MPEQLVFVGIGSNMNDPQAKLLSAVRRLKQLPQTEFCSVSSLYHSPPMGPQDQADYINAVAMLQTTLAPLPMLDALQAIETEHGRVRKGQRWGPRTLDLDILLFGEKVINLPRLIVPHPGLHERAFVLYPLYEIKPELTIPGSGRLSELVAACPQDGLEKI